MDARVFSVEASNILGCRTITGPDGIRCPAVPANMALYIASLMDTAYAAGVKLSKVDPATPENLNEVPPERPGGDQQSEETPLAVSRTLLHRQLFPVFVPDDTLRSIPAGATHYALRRLADGLAVDFWGMK